MLLAGRLAWLEAEQRDVFASVARESRPEGANWATGGSGSTMNSARGDRSEAAAMRALAEKPLADHAAQVR